MGLSNPGVYLSCPTGAHSYPHCCISEMPLVGSQLPTLVYIQAVPQGHTASHTEFLLVLSLTGTQLSTLYYTVHITNITNIYPAIPKNRQFNSSLPHTGIPTHWIIQRTYTAVPQIAMCPPMSTLIHYRLFIIIHVYKILAHTWAIPVYSHTGIPTLGFIQCTHTREPYRATCFPLSTLIQCLIFITIHVYNILAHSRAIPVYPHMGISTLWFYQMYPRTDTLQSNMLPCEHVASHSSSIPGE